MYEGTYTPTSSDVVPLIMISDYLQIKSLFDLARGSLKELLQLQQAPSMYLDSVHCAQCKLKRYGQSSTSPRTNLAQKLYPAFESFISSNFDMYEADTWTVFPYQRVAAVLAHPQNSSGSLLKTGVITAWFQTNRSVGTTEKQTQVDQASVHALVTALDTVSANNAVYIFVLSCEFKDSGSIALVLPIVLNTFDQLPEDSLLLLKGITDHKTLVEMLDADNLCATNEDVIFDFVKDYVQTHSKKSLKDKPDVVMRLWRCVRFSFVSSGKLYEAFGTPSVMETARDAIMLGMLAHISTTQDEGISSLAFYDSDACQNGTVFTSEHLGRFDVVRHTTPRKSDKIVC